jgi:hypothetical protein
VAERASQYYDAAEILFNAFHLASSLSDPVSGHGSTNLFGIRILF